MLNAFPALADESRPGEGHRPEKGGGRDSRHMRYPGSPKRASRRLP